MDVSRVALPSLAALLLIPLECFAAPAAPKPGLKVQEIFTAANPEGGKEFVCGGPIKGVYLPGKRKKVGKKIYFSPLRKELKELRADLPLLDGDAKTKVQKKIKRLKARDTAGRSACANTHGGGPTAPPGAQPLFELARAVTADDIIHLYRHAGLGFAPPGALAFAGKPVGELVTFFMAEAGESAVETEAQSWLDENTQAPHFPESNPSSRGLNLYALRLLSKTRAQFTERLALLALHDRLSTSSLAVDDVGSQRKLMVTHLNLLRDAAKSFDYRTLIEALGQDGVMVRWLTLDKNDKNQPNENYARELMELFSLDTKDSAGASNYTDDDIIQIARAFTGWNLLQPRQGEWNVIFTPASFDSDPNKIIFAGTAWQGRVQTSIDVVRHIFDKHPNAAPSTAKWLARQFLREDVPAPVIDELAALIKGSNFNLKPALERILKSEYFYLPENKLTIAKTPTERFVHLLRIMDAAGIPYDFASVRDAVAGMGCTVTQPDTVFGCDILEEVPVGQRLLASINFIGTLAQNATNIQGRPFRYLDLFSAVPSPDQAIDRYEELFQVTLPVAQRSAFLTLLENTVNQQGNLVPMPWANQSAQQRGDKLRDLFRAFAALPQIHDLR